MRASWSRIVTAISAAAVLAASVGLPGTLVGRKGEHSVGVAAPPVVVHSVVPAAPVPVARPPASLGRVTPRSDLVAVSIPVAAPRAAAPLHPAAPSGLTRPAPKPTAPAPTPTPAPALPPAA